MSSQDSTQKHEKFSVMTLNLRFGLADDGPNSWKQRRISFPPLFAEFPADIICLQEVNNFQIDELAAVLNGYRYIGQREIPPDRWQHNLIFYKNEIALSFQDHFYLSHTPDVPSKLKASKWPRQCVIGIFSRNGRSFACVNTHFDFKDSVQRETANMICRRLSDLSLELPVILMGDFNAEPGSPCYRVFTAPEDPQQTFHDIFDNDYRFTYHGFTGERKAGHIDWILYRGAQLENHYKKIIKNQYKGFFPSDHFPVYAEFSIERF